MEVHTDSIMACLKCGEKKKWKRNISFHVWWSNIRRINVVTILSCTHGIFGWFLLWWPLTTVLWIEYRNSKTSSYGYTYQINEGKIADFWASYCCYKSFNFVLVLCSPAGRSNIYFHWMLTWSDERFSAHKSRYNNIISRQMV